jgi:OOP family OmpA-OmpF porin
MKKYFMLTVVILLMAVVTAAQAEVKAGSVSLTPFAGYYFFEGNQDLKNSPTYGLRAGYNFTQNWGIEAFGSYTQTEIQNTGWEPWQDIQTYGIEGLYHFMPEGRLVPFIAIGVGGIFYGKGYNYKDPSYGERFEQSQYFVDYGAGLKFFLTDNIALRADVRHVLPWNSTKNNPDNLHNDLMATFGINFAFGGKKKALVETKAEEPAPEPAPVVVPPPAPAPIVVPPPAPAPVVVPPPAPAPKPVIIEKGRQTLNVKFDFDKSIIKKNYYQDIDNLAQVMKDYPDLNIVIEGHTDSVGTAAYNKKLSQQRAEAVKKYMVENGIDTNRLKAQGFGKNKPIASNKTKEGRQKNRRVEAAVDYIIEK